MTCHLREGLYLALSEPRAVFLDTCANRYFCLDGHSEQALCALVSGALDIGSAARLQPLIDTGLLLGDPAAGALESPPSGSLPTSEIDGSAAGALDLLIAAFAQFEAARLLRRHSLWTIHEQLDRRRAHLRDDAESSIAQRAAAIVAAFERLNPVLPPHDRCLPRALGICLMALRRHVPVVLAIGVAGSPFAAHAWAQLGGHVLADTPERIGRFTPIAAL